MAQGLRLVLLGPPGAGKGTQAQLLRDRLKVTHIGSGDLFRHHLGQGTPLGLRAEEYMSKGVLVPDKVTIGIILDKVMSILVWDGHNLIQDDADGHFVGDQFPFAHVLFSP